jgi:hypothetical protein
MKVNGQFHALASSTSPLLPGKRAYSTHSVGVWVSPTAGWDVWEKKSGTPARNKITVFSVMKGFSSLPKYHNTLDYCKPVESNLRFQALFVNIILYYIILY